MISFNNISENIRTPGHYAEVDNSRALQNLLPNPHKVLILGQKHSDGTGVFDTVYNISRDGLADGYFGPGSVLARMCETFKLNNKNTELHAMAVGSGIGGVAASGTLNFSDALRGTAEISVPGTYYFMAAGTQLTIDIPMSASGQAIASLLASAINANSKLPVHAVVATGSVRISAVQSGTLGNYIAIQQNFYAGQSNPLGFSRAVVITGMAGGTTDPDIGDAWAVIDGDQYQYICQPYIDDVNLTEIEDELSDRFGPMVDMQGHGFTAVRGTLASCTTLGNARNSPHNTIIGAYQSPTCPEEWAAALTGVASKYLNEDPARPLQYLELKGVIAPPVTDRFTQSERNTILYDGIATWITDNVGKVMIERCITTYQTNAYGLLDPSYLDIETLATLNEIRYQYKARMASRFLIPRFKLVDDTFPVQPGTFVAAPKTVKQEIISLFGLLQDNGLIENLEEFILNLVVERDSSDQNRVNVLLPPDLVNQFRVLATIIQFIL
jgi:phage tail sheath gpL-like